MYLDLLHYKPTFWNQSDSSGWSATGNTASQTGSSFTSMRSAPKFPNKAKIYFEFTTNASGLLVGIGVCNASASLTTFIGGDANGVSYYQNGSWSYNGSSGIATNAPASSAANAVICCAWDGQNQNIWVRIGTGNWNGSASANPATNSLGFSAALTGNLMVGITANAAGSGGVLNPGGSTFTGTIPNGFIPLNAAMNAN